MLCWGVGIFECCRWVFDAVGFLLPFSRDPLGFGERVVRGLLGAFLWFLAVSGWRVAFGAVSGGSRLVLDPLRGLAWCQAVCG